MGDNIAVTAGSGTAVSTEEVTTLNGGAVSAQHVQRVGAAVVTADGVAKDLLLGRNSDATSLSAALSTEDVALVGALTETAPASDTASSGLNGRLQRIAQRLTSLIALLPTALGANGGLKVEGVASGTVIPVDTELAAAAALADAAANPTTSMIGANLLGYNGATWDRVRVQAFRVDLNAVTITAIATLWTPTSGKKFRLMGGSISVSAASSVLFEDNSAGAGNFVWRTPKLSADTPYNFDLGNGKLSATINNVLKGTASAAATITGTLYGVEE